MGILGRIGSMHIVRVDKQSIIEEFDELLHILGRAMSAD